MAVAPADRVSSVVLINAVGIAVPGHPITDVSGLRIDQLADLSYYEPDRFRIDPTTLPPARREAMAANAAVFAGYAGDPYMHDPALLARLATVDVPALVLWGEADGIVDLGYGRAYAEAIPGAEFSPVARAGHLPHIEQPDVVRDRIWQFARQFWRTSAG
jgi:pimeloyl-ACP methyl ester carboxylesterase